MARAEVNDDYILQLLENSDVDDLSSEVDEFEDSFPPSYDPHASNISSEGEVEGVTEDVTSDVPKICKSTAPLRKIIWKKKEFSEKVHPTPDIDRNLQSPPAILSPLQYLQEYFGDNFFENAAEKTNMYSVAKTGKSLLTTAVEIKKNFGINLYMGCIPYPRLSMYWQKGLELKLVSTTMSRDRFFALRKNLHVVDTVNKPHDSENNALWKFQPIINCVRGACLQIPRDHGTYSIDEQMIPFTGRCKLKQYVKNKPCPVGLKNFLLTTSTGTLLDFEVYQGKTTLLPCRKLRLGPSVVIRLVESLPIGSFVYFDRYFTTIPLLGYLTDRGIEGTGTIMVNRIRDVKLKSDKMSRGKSHEYVRSDEKFVVVEWKDSQKVIMASKCSGIKPEKKVRRWSKAEGKYIDIDCPSIVFRYNQCMGGVDVNNQQTEYYRTWFRTRKWTLKCILHFLDVATVNSWMVYRRDCLINQKKRRERKDLLQFRMDVAEALISTPEKKRKLCAPEEDGNYVDDNESAKNCKIYTPLLKPGCDKRFDDYDHWPVIDDIKSPRICRLEGCKSRTKARCSKCDVYLCLSKEKNCFVVFHTSK